MTTKETRPEPDPGQLYDVLVTRDAGATRIPKICTQAEIDAMRHTLNVEVVGKHSEAPPVEEPEADEPAKGKKKK